MIAGTISGPGAPRQPLPRRTARVAGEQETVFPAAARGAKRWVRRGAKEYRDMAMTMTGEYQLPAAQQTVWEKLNDPAVLKACIPGCEELNKTSDTGFQAAATIKIGPVKARFKG